MYFKTGSRRCGEWVAMGMQCAVSTCFSKCVTFQGRASRPEFWFWMLFITVVIIVLEVLAGLVATELQLVVGLFALVIILPTVSVAVRRLHDTGRSGWWYFIQLIPAVGGIWFLYLMVIAGTVGPNEFDGGPAVHA